ncbi:unnamed protein product [Urochloa humidicola]
MAFLPGAGRRLLCSLFLCLSLSAAARAATTHHHEWEISYQFKSPDCVQKLAVAINGQTPGPTIRATQGDTVVVRVNNSLLTENVAIHWHGIRQIGAPWADGTEGVTQCPILPGDTFTYTFAIDRPGTYMYHAHYGMQSSAGLNGLIVVEAAPGGPDAEPFRYDGEHAVLLNDWWHKSTYEQSAGLASVPLVWVGEPQSLLINGRGRFVNCSSMAPGACNATHPECATPVFAVVPGRTYRFRIASVTSLSALNFEIEGDTFVARVKSSLLTDNAAIQWHGIRQIGMPWADSTEGVSQRPILPGDVFTYTFVVDRPGRTYMYHAHYGMQRSAGFNGLIIVEAAPGAPRGSKASSPFRSDGELAVLLNDWCEPSTTRPDGPADRSETHPWHLHGHDFWVLGYGKGRFDPAVHPVTWYKLKDPILKNTVAVHPYGWTALLFKENNPGLLAFHCHIEAALPECDTPVFAVVPGKTYRSRIANLKFLSALNFDIEAPRPPTIDAYYYLAEGLVVVMLYLLVATAAEGTITSAPSPSASDILPLITYPPSRIGTAATANNPSELEGSVIGKEEEDPSGPPGGSPPQRPVPPTVGVRDRDNEAKLLAFVAALWAYESAVVLGILLHGFESICSGWSTAPKVVYILSTVLVGVLLAVAFTAAGCHISSAAGNIQMLRVSAFCSKLGAVLSSDLLVVALSCKLGRGGRVAAVPSAAVMTLIMAAVWMYGGIDHHAPASSQSQPAAAGDDMA